MLVTFVENVINLTRTLLIDRVLKFTSIIREKIVYTTDNCIEISHHQFTGGKNYEYIKEDIVCLEILSGK